jgi:hypothetical protein
MSRVRVLLVLDGVSCFLLSCEQCKDLIQDLLQRRSEVSSATCEQLAEQTFPPPHIESRVLTSVRSSTASRSLKGSTWHRARWFAPGSLCEPTTRHAMSRSVIRAIGQILLRFDDSNLPAVVLGHYFGCLLDTVLGCAARKVVGMATIFTQMGADKSFSPTRNAVSFSSARTFSQSPKC